MKGNRENGFTIAELLVGMIAFSILAITIGAMIILAIQGWTRMRAMGDMERDGSLAMQTMTRVIRQASVTNWSTTVAQFTRSGDSLRYKNMNLVREGVRTFTNSVNLSTNKVTVVLILSNSTANATMNLSNTITLRN